MKGICFWKMSGAGNDFIIIDNRESVIDLKNASYFASKVCKRRISVGADGLILIEKSDKADFSWNFFNSDGSIAGMCGNGARCAARFAFLNSIADKNMHFETIAGIISASVNNESVKIRMTDPFDFKRDVKIQLEETLLTGFCVNTGTPHAVIFVDDTENTDVVRLGRKIRFHKDFAPKGVNVNFICLNNDEVNIRTYERGVEDETLACGTGAAAGALAAADMFKLKSPIKMRVRSKEILYIHFSEKNGVFLEGGARIVCKGTIEREAVT